MYYSPNYLYPMIGSHVVTVKATDADVDAVLEYSIAQKYRPYLSINKVRSTLYIDTYLHG